jgi:hypothetical protein
MIIDMFFLFGCKGTHYFFIAQSTFIWISRKKGAVTVQRLIYPAHKYLPHLANELQSRKGVRAFSLVGFFF